MSILEEVVDAFTREARHSINKQVSRFELELDMYVRRLVVKNTRVMAYVAAAASLVIVGFVSTLYGSATYLAQFTPPGVSWVIIGAIGAGIGALMLMQLRR